MRTLANIEKGYVYLISIFVVLSTTKILCVYLKETTNFNKIRTHWNSKKSLRTSERISNNFAYN